MPFPDVDDLHREDLVLHRTSALVAQLVLDDATQEEGSGLVDALTRLGWTPSTADATAEIVVGATTHHAALLDAVGAHHPSVVAVRDPVGTASAAWPGWDDAVLRLGYEPCQYTGTWRIYVVAARAAALGPLLAAPVNDDELCAAGVPTRADLEREVAQWRNAAVDGWAVSVDAVQPVRPPDEVTVEQLQAHINALQATLSWRVTAPLRAVQRRRLARAAR